MFGLTYVQFNILRLAALSDNHTAVNFFAGADKQRSSVLCGKQTIGNGFACLKGN